MNARVTRTGILAVAASLAMFGCSRMDATPDPAAGNAAAERDRVETYVQARFQADNQIRGHDINVSAEGGRVTLTGTVPTEEARQHAVTVARDVSGVQSVEDRLSVAAAPAMPSGAMSTDPATPAAAPAVDRTRQPGWITTKIQAQYFTDPDIGAWDIDVTTASNGVVTLSGRVDDVTDRDQAVRIARATEGVTQVNDQLTIGEAGAMPNDDAGDGSSQPDPWITAKIQSKYFLDAEVKGRNINVDTQNGQVTLHGSVGSEAERRQAVSIARSTEGVRDVQDRLAIDATANTMPNSQTGLARGADAADDAWVTVKIQSKFFLDRDIKGRTIDVTSNGGAVTLQGTVRSEEEKTAAEQIARATDGVTSVENRLRVDTTR